MTRLPANPPDHYATLGVPDTASHQAIQQAYRALMRQTHPDVAGADACTQQTAAALNAAWSVLRDPRRRAEYDRARAARLGSRPGAAPASQPMSAGEPSWGPGGIRPVTVEQLREAAARESAYGQIGAQTRAAFSRASLRIGWLVLLVGAVMLALVVRA